METKFKQEPTDIVKVVLYGPESTGKTSLSEKLADHYKTLWVPEYAREYLQEKWENEKKICEPKDIMPIAAGQMQMENQMAKQVNRLLICDTNLLETKVYSEVYFSGHAPEPLTKVALNSIYDVYFLTYIDTPWEADDLRDKPNERMEMFQKFKAMLDEHQKPYIILKGNLEERFAIAVGKIDQILKAKEIGI